MSDLGQLLREQIRKQGPLPFAVFMKQALYHPEWGYYEKGGRQIGARGDFITNVSLGPLYGRLLAAGFAEWMAEFTGGSVQLVEVGAHRGDLARDILQGLSELRPPWWNDLQYWILEPSPTRRGWQEETLQAWRELGKVRWWDGLEQLPERSVRGALLSNEFLDALPVRRLGWDRSNQAWFEWGVDEIDGTWSWVRLPLPVEEVRAMGQSCGMVWTSDLEEVLPDGYTLDWCPEAGQWWAAAARRLQAGYLMTSDYGLTAEEWLRPERRSGTVRGYRQQTLVENLLAEPGQHDMTAHVNFTQLEKAGASEGLVTRCSQVQERFLTPILQQLWDRDRGYVEKVRGWVRQFQGLTHPGRMGRPFRVLVQARAWGGG